ncbi:MAG: hypothetical protein ABIA76_04175 [Candidatus Diapherotrites archaeon]
MKLLVGIHLNKDAFASPERLKAMDFFISENFRKDQNTNFLLFEWPLSTKLLRKLRDSHKQKENFHSIKPHLNTGEELYFSPIFSDYRKGFFSVLEKIPIKPGEEIEVIYFGGGATECFKSIFSGMRKEVNEYFKAKKIKAKQRAEPAFMYETKNKRVRELIEKHRSNYLKLLNLIRNRARK